MELQTALQDYGLDQKEVKTYLYLHTHGKKTAHEISRGTEILRQTAYDTLTKLVHKGLVSTNVENNKTIFLANDPKAFIDLLQEKEKIIRQILPELHKIKDPHQDKTNTKIFRGISGIKLLYQDFLTSNTAIYTIQPPIPEKFLKEYFIENFLVKRVEKKIRIRILKENIVTKFQENIRSDKKKLREVRTLNKMKEFSAHMVIYDDKVIFMDYQDEPTAVLISSKCFADAQRILFEIAWASGKKA